MMGMAALPVAVLVSGLPIVHHIAMEVMVEEMRSHGFPLPIDDMPNGEHYGQGYGNFPTDGIFHQGDD